MTATRAQRAALYHRVSTSDQDTQAPLTELERAARSDGFTELEIFTETGSGALNDRPGLHAVMKLVRQRRVAAVYVWKLDRFGRSALDLLSQLHELDTRKVRFVATSQGIDIGSGADAVGRMMLTMLAGVAEFERDLIRERTRLGLARAKDRGVKLGRPPVKLPPAERVRALRDQGETWGRIAALYGCTVWAARKAAQGSCEKRGPDGPGVLPRISGLRGRPKSC